MQAESGLRRLRASEVLFKDGDKAYSLFIIQKGQLRLYKPKGKGFVEIAVLRAGEVIGEMAFFDSDGGGRRSCSASAMGECEVIEISFTAFNKTMQGLNPWFKTIINTLAGRLRSANSRIRELESNSASLNYGSKSGSYEYLRPHDLLKCLGTLFLVFKSHATTKDQGLSLARKTINFYLKDIYHIPESKFDEVMLLLKEQGILEIEIEEKSKQEFILLSDIESLRSLFIFYNTQRHLVEDKKFSLSRECVFILKAIKETFSPQAPKGDEQKGEVCISKILEAFQDQNRTVDIKSLDEAIKFDIVDESVVGENNQIFANVDWKKLNELLPKAIFMNAVADLNEKKA